MFLNYSNSTDNELLSALKEGDRAAFNEIYNRNVILLLNHAYNKLRDREMAKDMVQDVFVTLWQKRAILQISSNLTGYLYTALRNSILNHIVHKDVQAKYLDSMLRFEEEEPLLADHQVRERQFSEIIEKEIADLTPKMREVFELSRKKHLSHKEIADQLNISEQTVSKHMTNALKILRLKLGIVIYLLFIA